MPILEPVNYSSANIGGLSDVDWLVEEGLQDINDESGRWSVPFILGARLRF